MCASSTRRNVEAVTPGRESARVATYAGRSCASGAALSRHGRSTAGGSFVELTHANPWDGADISSRRDCMAANLRKAGWVLMTVLAVMIALIALMTLVLPGFGPPFVAEHRSLAPVALVAHLAGGLTAMALGPWQPGCAGCRIWYWLSGSCCDTGLGQAPDRHEVARQDQAFRRRFTEHGLARVAGAYAGHRLPVRNRGR